MVKKMKYGWIICLLIFIQSNYAETVVARYECFSLEDCRIKFETFLKEQEEVLAEEGFTTYSSSGAKMPGFAMIHFKDSNWACFNSIIKKIRKKAY